ncbi:hypothetical protein Q9Q94_17805 [Uliginosibacterium sp. 31-16]|uniref:hypothetical protein n=1 Tax=Uliginosibacterium sp. 31-16 TaxID=3068315 RepID=UPI00273D2873|nr:hypothetical protein [Uliginosibacterium sp. 31-16]MDP5241394.1 hypothetical protein [Uliginosibacterium sp. 31-16]
MDNEDRASFWSRTWIMALLAVPISTLILLGIIFPLLPTTKAGWLACASTGILFSVWILTGTLLEGWIERQPRFQARNKAIAILPIIAMMGGALWFYTENQAFIAANFAYWNF